MLQRASLAVWRWAKRDATRRLAAAAVTRDVVADHVVGIGLVRLHQAKQGVEQGEYAADK